MSMLKELHSKSINKQKREKRTSSTPKQDECKLISEIDVCYSIEYYNHKVKTFWDGKTKAYTHPIRADMVNEWNEFKDSLQEYEDDELTIQQKKKYVL